MKELVTNLRKLKKVSALKLEKSEVLAALGVERLTAFDWSTSDAEARADRLIEKYLTDEAEAEPAQQPALVEAGSTYNAELDASRN